jgi:hypothetical protein
MMLCLLETAYNANKRAHMMLCLLETAYNAIVEAEGRSWVLQIL